MEWFKDKNRRVGILGTALFHVVLIMILAFLSLKPPYPPPPQLGVEVNLGNNNEGMGKIQPKEAKQVSKVEPKTTNKVEKIVTQTTEQSININKKNDKVEKTKPKEVEEPKIDKRFIFNKQKNSAEGGSEGKTGTPGDQGMTNGDPNANNYVGDGGSGGVSFQLSGRKKLSLPLPPKGFKEEGTVVVKIWVNKYGKVTNAKVSMNGTTTTNNTLHRRAITAAMKAEFDSNPNAPEVQTGTITYKFILSN